MFLPSKRPGGRWIKLLFANDRRCTCPSELKAFGSTAMMFFAARFTYGQRISVSIHKQTGLSGEMVPQYLMVYQCFLMLVTMERPFGIYFWGLPHSRTQKSKPPVIRPACFCLRTATRVQLSIRWPAEPTCLEQRHGKHLGDTSCKGTNLLTNL